MSKGHSAAAHNETIFQPAALSVFPPQRLQVKTQITAHTHSLPTRSKSQASISETDNTHIWSDTDDTRKLHHPYGHSCLGKKTSTY